MSSSLYAARSCSQGPAETYLDCLPHEIRAEIDKYIDGPPLPIPVFKQKTNNSYTWWWRAPNRYFTRCLFCLDVHVIPFYVHCSQCCCLSTSFKLPKCHVCDGWMYKSCYFCRRKDKGLIDYFYIPIYTTMRKIEVVWSHKVSHSSKVKSEGSCLPVKSVKSHGV